MSEQNRPKLSFIVHGCPQGYEVMQDDNIEYMRYANFHTASDTNIEHPSSPGEKSITATLPSGTTAYTFVRTGVHEEHGSRSGSNYIAITLFVPAHFKVSNPQQLHQQLKQFFETNILEIYTHKQSGGWLRWASNWKDLFNNNKVIQSLGNILNDQVIKSCITERNKSNKENFSDATKKIQQQITELEQAIIKKEQELIQLRTKLETLKKQM